MFPNELAILMAIGKDGELGVRQLTHVTDVTGVYLRYICNSLSLRGYLERKNSKGYQATLKGYEVILKALRQDEVGTTNKVMTS